MPITSLLNWDRFSLEGAPPTLEGRSGFGKHSKFFEPRHFSRVVIPQLLGLIFVHRGTNNSSQRLCFLCVTDNTRRE